jgi:hypothetical protein
MGATERIGREVMMMVGEIEKKAGLHQAEL